jgi:RNA polymerase sigma factor (sigma-70 family)
MNKTYLTEPQRKLITDNYRLLRHFIGRSIKNKVVPRYLEHEFISKILLKFCISALKFDEELGYKFSTYAYRGFQLGLKDVLSYENTRFGQICYLEDVEQYEIECEKVDELRDDFFYDFIDNIDLGSRDKSIMEDYYYEGLSFSKIGQKKNLTGEAVRLVVDRSLNKIRHMVHKRRLNMEDFYK